MNLKHMRSRRMLSAMAASTVLYGCGPGGDESSQVLASSAALVAPAPTPSPTPTPTATAAPSPSANVVVQPDGSVQMAKVADGLSVESLLASTPVAGSAAPDVVGAFRFKCAPSHISYDDPIVHPGKPGANAHLHIFFGNTEADANSTYQSLRTTGDSTCRNVLNRSAYWQPAMLGKITSGQEVVIVEDYTNFYYKARPAGDPKAAGIQIAIPRGLRFVFGGMGKPALFKCISADGNSNVTNWLPTMQQALALCSVGQKLDIMQTTPECWDGKNLDSPDHRSHMAWVAYDQAAKKDRCPSTHPFVLPQLTFQRVFTINADDITTTWRLSSDGPGDLPGSMAHADYMMGWNDEVHERWMAACINLLRNCSGADLGDGAILVVNEITKKAGAARRVPAPKRGDVFSLLVK